MTIKPSGHLYDFLIMFSSQDPLEIQVDRADQVCEFMLSD